MSVPDNEKGFHAQDCVLRPKSPVLRRDVYKANNMWHFVCIIVQRLGREVTVLKEGPLF